VYSQPPWMFLRDGVFTDADCFRPAHPASHLISTSLGDNARDGKACPFAADLVQRHRWKGFEPAPACVASYCQTVVAGPEMPL